MEKHLTGAKGDRDHFDLHNTVEIHSWTPEKIHKHPRLKNTIPKSHLEATLRSFPIKSPWLCKLDSNERIYICRRNLKSSCQNVTLSLMFSLQPVTTLRCFLHRLNSLLGHRGMSGRKEGRLRGGCLGRMLWWKSAICLWILARWALIVIGFQPSTARTQEVNLCQDSHWLPTPHSSRLLGQLLMNAGTGHMRRCHVSVHPH